MSVTIDPTTPADSSSPTLGAADIRAVTAQLQEMFGGAGSAGITYAVVPFIVDPTTGLTTVPGPPTDLLGIATKKYVNNGQNTNFIGTVSGTNTYSVTMNFAPVNLAAISGVPLTLLFTNANTGASTLNVNSLGAQAITKNGSTALSGGEIHNFQYVSIVWDGTNFQLLTV